MLRLGERKEKRYTHCQIVYSSFQQIFSYSIVYVKSQLFIWVPLWSSPTPSFGPSPVVFYELHRDQTTLKVLKSGLGINCGVEQPTGNRTFYLMAIIHILANRNVSICNLNAQGVIPVEVHLNRSTNRIGQLFRWIQVGSVLVLNIT